jgi:hypothetical protein
VTSTFIRGRRFFDEQPFDQNVTVCLNNCYTPWIYDNFRFGADLGSARKSRSGNVVRLRNRLRSLAASGISRRPRCNENTESCLGDLNSFADRSSLIPACGKPVGFAKPRDAP